VRVLEFEAPLPPRVPRDRSAPLARGTTRIRRAPRLTRREADATYNALIRSGHP
jgi:hypothetical protein